MFQLLLLLLFSYLFGLKCQYRSDKVEDDSHDVDEMQLGFFFAFAMRKAAVQFGLFHSTVVKYNARMCHWLLLSAVRCLATM